MKTRSGKKKSAAFTMVEILVVVVILALLVSLSFPAYRLVKVSAQSAESVSNLKQIATATITWSAENNDKLPSPIYPGGDPRDEEFLPKYWNFQETDTGLWLDGVVFAAVYVEKDGGGPQQEMAEKSFKYSGQLKAGHIKTSFFESKRSSSMRGRSFDEDGNRIEDSDNYYRHSYAMNANLQYDRIYDDLKSGGDPWLTEKSLAQLIHSPNALLYIDCIEKNVIMADDLSLIEDTIEKRWRDKFAVAAFLDGHVEKLRKSDLPKGNPDNDIQASRFWRGVDYRD